MSHPSGRRSPPSTGRRRLVRTCGLALGAALAGCSEGETGPTPDDGGEPGDETATTEGATATPDPGTSEPETGDGATPTRTTGEGSPGETSGTTEPDLREANVTAVEFEGDDGSYRFDVTLYHDDDGEDGYADWWQVESLAGERLGRRELLHAHSTDPFTRSETIDVPSGVTCVVVRGHDQTHAYGGQAMLVNLDTGATRAVDQGTEPSTFDGDDCP